MDVAEGEEEEIKIFKFNWIAEDESQATTINMIHGWPLTRPSGAGLGVWNMLLCKAMITGLWSGVRPSCGAIKQIHCLDKNETINFYGDGSVDV